MSISIIQSLPAADAVKAVRDLSLIRDWRDACLPADLGAAHLVHEEGWPTDLGVDGPFLLLVLPDDLAPDLEDLATATFDAYNRDSKDLQTRSTLLTLAADKSTSGRTIVEIDAWQCMFPLSVEDSKFYVGFLAAGRFVLARHDYDEAEMDSLIGGLQGAFGSSGPNYNPWRYWSEEELEAAALGQYVQVALDSDAQERIVNCKVVFDGNPRHMDHPGWLWLGGSPFGVITRGDKD